MGDYHLLKEDKVDNSNTNPEKAVDISNQQPQKITWELIKLYFRHPSKLLEERFSPGSLKGSVFNILAATIGAGILTLPYAVNLVGLYLGFFILIAGFMASLYTSRLLITSSDWTTVASYEGLGETLYGSKMRTFCEVIIIINNFGIYVAYLVILMGLGPHVFHLMGIDNDILKNQFLWGGIMAVFIVYPLTIAKSISALRYTSALSAVACAYLAILVTIEYFVMNDGETLERFTEAPIAEIDPYRIFMMCPLIFFAYTCHPSVLMIYAGLNRKTTVRGHKFLWRGLVTVMIIYVLVGVFGYLTFYDDKGGYENFPKIILSANYREGSAGVIVGTITMFITLLCGCPMLLHPCRNATLSLIFKDKQAPRTEFLALATILVFGGLGLSWVAPNIISVLSLVGSLTNPIISYILPCLFYIKAHPGNWYSSDLLLCRFVMFFMSGIAIMGVVMFWYGIAK